MLDRPATALRAAAMCLGGLVLTGFVAHLLARGEALDRRLLDAFTALREYDVDGVLTTVVHLGDALPYLFMTSAIVLVALARERPRLALAVAVVLVAAPSMAQLIKFATAHVRPYTTPYPDYINQASWPSGHAAGAMAAAMCAVLVAPRSLRPLVALFGGLYALVIGYAVIALVWHFPSDVVGAYFLSATWVLLAVAALRRWPDPASERQVHGTVASGVALALVAGGCLAVLGLSHLRPGGLLDAAARNTTLVVGGAAIAMLATALAAVLLRTTRND